MLNANQELRILQGWESRRGEPYEPAAIVPPIFEGHPEVARWYSCRIATFALRVFHNREKEFYGQANELIRENSRYYIEHTDVRDDRDSFYWNIGEICRCILRYGTLGSDEPGLVTAATEAVFLEMAYGYCRDMSKREDSRAEGMLTWRIYESENHHVQRDSALWQLLLILIRYGQGDRPIADGGTVREHFDAWTAFFKKWLRERAGKSMLVEVHSKVYQTHTLKNLIPLYDFGDRELRRLTGHFITLFWATWAEEQLNGIQGGGMSRVYPDEALTTHSEAGRLSWYYFGLTSFEKPDDSDYVSLDCAWRAPEWLFELATADRGTYTTESRPFGKASPDDLYPDYRVDTDWGHIYRYTYCTPHMVMGTQMYPDLPKNAWCLISSQNRFQGITFGIPDALVVPMPRPAELHNLHSVRPNIAFNSWWSAMKEGTLITQRTVEHPAEMRVWLSKAGGLSQVREEGGWIFTECGGVQVGIKVVRGGWHMEEEAGYGSESWGTGRWIVCEDPDTPVILEASDRFGSAEEFQQAVFSCALRDDGRYLTYRSLYGHDFVFVTDHSGKESTVDGEYYVKRPDISFRSPYINGEWGGSHITVTAGGEDHILDFS